MGAFVPKNICTGEAGIGGRGLAGVGDRGSFGLGWHFNQEGCALTELGLAPKNAAMFLDDNLVADGKP